MSRARRFGEKDVCGLLEIGVEVGLQQVSFYRAWGQTGRMDLEEKRKK